MAKSLHASKGCDQCLKLTVAATIFALLVSLKCFSPYNGLLFYIKNSENPLTSKCPTGTFRVGTMSGCHPFLSCSEITGDLTVTDHVLGEGAQKMVKKGLWLDHEVAVNILKHQDYMDDFAHGLDMLRLFSEKPGHRENGVVQLIGWCFDTTSVIVTELHSMGAACDVHAVIRDKFPNQDSLLTRFRMCVEFVQILKMLHTHHAGTRVFCDANYPEKALSQFLLSDNLSLVLNDMDALPSVDRKLGQLVKCGHRELQGDFVAPEQRWDLDEEYDDTKMSHYDEKIDIWKIPDVCNFLIGDVHGASKMQLHLFQIHLKCKQVEPSKRPSAEDILELYKEIYVKLQ